MKSLKTPGHFLYDFSKFIVSRTVLDEDNLMEKHYLMRNLLELDLLNCDDIDIRYINSFFEEKNIWRFLVWVLKRQNRTLREINADLLRNLRKDYRNSGF